MTTKATKTKTYRTGYSDLAIKITRDGQGWFYEGPASCGPKEVRCSGRGPYWRGPISPQFAGALLRNLRERNMLVGEGQP